MPVEQQLLSCSTLRLSVALLPIIATVAIKECQQNPRILEIRIPKFQYYQLQPQQAERRPRPGLRGPLLQPRLGRPARAGLARRAQPAEHRSRPVLRPQRAWTRNRPLVRANGKQQQQQQERQRRQSMRS